MGKALASPRRLELLEVLAQAPRTIELAEASDQSTANTSSTSRFSHSAGLVTREREGTRVRYALAGDEALFGWLYVTPRPPSWAKSSARHALPRRGGREHRTRGTAQEDASRRRRPGRCSSTGGVRGRPHRRRALDSPRRVRETPHRAPVRARSDRLLPRPLLCVRHEAVRQLQTPAARPAGSRRAGPSGSSPSPRRGARS